MPDLQTKYTWATFVAAVQALLPVDSQRQNTSALFLLKLAEAVGEIQQYIEFYRTGHESSFMVSDVAPYGLASLGTLPDFCIPESAVMVETHVTGGRMPLSDWNWANVDDLKNGAARVVSNQGWISIDPHARQFVVYPAIDDDWHMLLRWNGIKTNFADADEVPFDLNCVSAAAEYVKGYVHREVERSPDFARDCMANFRIKLAEMHSIALQRQRQNRARDTQAPDPCSTVNLILSSACPCASQAQPDTIDLVALGDIGTGGADSALVAQLVHSLNPQFLVLLGDLAYPDGTLNQVQDVLLKLYGDYVPDKAYPVWGNHDLEAGSLIGGVYGVPLAETFPAIIALNSGKYYYEFTIGSARFFVLNSGYSDADPREADGITAAGVQAAWLQAALAASTEPWKIVCLHRSPYSSDATYYPGINILRWPFYTWGANMILAGHTHTYERLLVDGLPVINSGLGGTGKRGWNNPVIVASQFRYNSDYGAVRMVISATRLQAIFYRTTGEVIDNVQYSLT